MSFTHDKSITNILTSILAQIISEASAGGYLKFEG